jgi:hypothetical protein
MRTASGHNQQTSLSGRIRFAVSVAGIKSFRRYAGLCRDCLNPMKSSRSSARAEWAYRARDVKLKRDVALRALHEAFARDPERMARFQREAEALASLNHPNIAAIFGVEDRAQASRVEVELAQARCAQGCSIRKPARLTNGPLQAGRARSRTESRSQWRDLV